MTRRIRHEIDVIDSHTEGEPTRIIVAGGPPLGAGPLTERREKFRAEFDEYRATTVLEPRGSDVLVGGLLCDAHEPGCEVGVIFFNNAGYLGMCGHGMIGFLVTLEFLGRIKPGSYRIDTPVGVVGATLTADSQVSIVNVPAYRLRANVEVDVADYGRVRGDIAWGGNWFFLVKQTPERIALNNVERLSDVTRRIERALHEQGITGKEGKRIDHVELFGPGHSTNADSQNFVLCPGGAYDRSPCGTGTSAKLACLAADGDLAPGQIWRQAGILGSVFECSYEAGPGESVIPRISGRAYICARTRLIVEADDPFAFGIRA